MLSADEYTRLLQGQIAQQAFLPVTSLAQIGNPTACLSQSSTSVGPWVFDSGATDHMSGNTSLFSHMNRSSSLPHVTIANGSTTSVEGIGSARLSPNISLSFVLYIPNFLFDLVFVSKLTKHLNCSMTFYFDSFIS